MGRFDNYDNKEGIQFAQKKLDKLKRKRKPDLFAIELAQKELDNEKLFSSCQIFRAKFSRVGTPDIDVLFSDDNKVMMFYKQVIRYEDIASYKILESITKRAHTTSRPDGAISRAIVGDMIAGNVGAIIGAATADVKSTTTYTTHADGFIIKIFLKNGKGYQAWFESGGLMLNKLHPLWLDLCKKLQMIIDENSNK